jgi:hypothetical protein
MLLCPPLGYLRLLASKGKPNPTPFARTHAKNNAINAFHPFSSLTTPQVLKLET